MQACPRPRIDYPCRVPLKVIGRQSELDVEAVLALIRTHLGPQGEEDLRPTSHTKGAYISYTIWVTLRDATEEGPLRTAIHRLPGVVYQL